MKNQPIIEKSTLHPRNNHCSRYDFETLYLKSPELKPLIFINEHEIETIDFSNPEAVKSLNQVDLSKVIEMSDNTALMDQAACAGGACEIV